MSEPLDAFGNRSMFNALKGRDPFTMDDLEDSRRKLLAAIVTNAFAYGECFHRFMVILA
jgi:hypothetical protein